MEVLQWFSAYRSLWKLCGAFLPACFGWKPSCGNSRGWWGGYPQMYEKFVRTACAYFPISRHIRVFGILTWREWALMADGASLRIHWRWCNCAPWSWSSRQNRDKNRERCNAVRLLCETKRHLCNMHDCQVFTLTTNHVYNPKFDSLINVWNNPRRHTRNGTNDHLLPMVMKMGSKGAAYTDGASIPTFCSSKSLPLYRRLINFEYCKHVALSSCCLCHGWAGDEHKARRFGARWPIQNWCQSHDVRFLQKRSEDSEDATCGGIEIEQNDNCRDTVLWAAGGGKWLSCNPVSRSTWIIVSKCTPDVGWLSLSDLCQPACLQDGTHVQQSGSRTLRVPRLQAHQVIFDHLSVCMLEVSKLSCNIDIYSTGLDGPDGHWNPPRDTLVCSLLLRSKL